MSTVPSHAKNNGTRYKVSIEDGPELGRGIILASSWGARLKGLLGTKSLAEGDGLLLVPCSSIHMFFMAIPLDVLFLTPEGVVVALYHSIKPWRISRHHSEALAALELPAGQAAACNIEIGDRLLFEPAP